MKEIFCEDSLFFLVDPQKGFSEECPDELPVCGATAIVPTINELLLLPWNHIYASIDWHTEDHSSFLEQGGLYKKHCIGNKSGSEFLTGLLTEYIQIILRKGTKKNIDNYSAGREYPGMFNIMACNTPGKSVYLAGICTNICVAETAFDFKDAGFANVNIIEDACATLNLPPDNPYYYQTMRNKCLLKGIKFINSDKVFVDNKFRN